MKRLVGMTIVILFLFAPVIYGAEKLDINKATKAELMKLPKIGEKLADRIIEYRETHGGFKSVEELMRIKGIGKKKFAEIKDLVTVGEVKK